MPEMMDSWNANKYKYFVQDPNDPKQTKFPGLWKEEYSTETGVFIALSPKSYYIRGTKAGEKMSSKGVSHGAGLNEASYLDALFGNSQKVTNVQMNKKNGLVYTIKQDKIGLSDQFVKGFVENDRITIKPFDF